MNNLNAAVPYLMTLQAQPNITLNVGVVQNKVLLNNKQLSKAPISAGGDTTAGATAAGAGTTSTGGDPASPGGTSIPISRIG